MSTTGQGGMPGPPTEGPSRARPGTTTAPTTQPTPTQPGPPRAAQPAPRPGQGAGTQGPGPRPVGSGQRPAPRPGGPRQQAPRRPASGQTARRVRLAVARVDPWSVIKMSFLLAVAAGIAGVVVTMALWLLLSAMGVFTDIDRIIKDLLSSSTTSFEIMDYIGFGRVISLSVVFGVINIVLLTAISTLGAFLYNICAALVGGLQLTLTDD